MVERRRPVHLAVLVGVSTSAYAISLAGVTALQSVSDARVIAQRAPAVQAASLMTAGHDRLENRLEGAQRAYVMAAGRYARLGSDMADMEGALTALGHRVTKVTGAMTSMPTRVTLPSLSGGGSTVVTRTTVVHATTGASGH